MNTLFMVSLGLYFAATLLCFAGAAFRKDGLKKAARIVMIVAASVHLVYIIWRGVAAHRLPLANQPTDSLVQSHRSYWTYHA